MNHPLPAQVAQTTQQRVNVCPGHSITLEKVKGLKIAAVRTHGDGAFEPSPCGDDDAALVSPGASLRSVVALVGGLPRPLFLGVRTDDDGDGGNGAPPTNNNDNPVPTTGFDLLSPQHLDDDGAVAVDGDVAEGATAAWHTLCAVASTRELEAAAEASRVALRLAKQDKARDVGEKSEHALPLRSGLDETLSVLGCVVFTCSGRGTHFHKARNKDSLALRAGQPKLPIVGCFCNGEIGPPPFHERGGGTSSTSDPHIAGFTCSSVICRLDGADEVAAGPETLLPPPPPPQDAA